MNDEVLRFAPAECPWRWWQVKLCLSFLVLVLAGISARADDSFAAVSEKVNPKVVKLFGSGGFTGLVSYGTGVLVSPDGYVLTVAGHMLDTQDLRVHDGTMDKEVKP